MAAKAPPKTAPARDTSPAAAAPASATTAAPAPAAPTPTASTTWFWRYFAGSTVSRVGTAVTTVALPLTALAAAHASSFEVGAVTAAGYAAWAVVGLPAGVLVGRLPLRGTQIAMDLVRAGALASVPVAWWVASVTVAQLVLVALVVGVASVVFDVGNATMLPFLVGKEELTARNSLTSGAEAVTNLAGPSLGGALVQAVGAAGAIAVDVVSYLISAFLLRNVPRPSKAVQDAGSARSGSVRAAVREGWHYLIREPIQRANLWDATAMNFICGAQMALTPLFLVRTLGLNPAWVGAMMAAEGLGSLFGASLTPRLTRRIGSGRALLIASLALPFGFALMPLAGHGWAAGVFALGNAAFAATVVVASIVTRTYRQTATPPELLPRVMATVRVVSWGVIPIGALAAGAVATWYGPRAALWCAAAATLVVPVVVLTSPIRTRRDIAEG
ncbi:MFS transporter [Catenulispora sp. NL8]|uniref:MFS transporter n=1 Tax=Catenulispora pinistramenti TaxID=2705254 RepID=A0ABS5L5Z0_9ACTN|nr:MFS transporter [Catenulispora pinistramenti]